MGFDMFGSIIVVLKLTCKTALSESGGRRVLRGGETRRSLISYHVQVGSDPESSHPPRYIGTSTCTNRGRLEPHLNCIEQRTVHDLFYEIEPLCCCIYTIDLLQIYSEHMCVL